jgi:hypothetical protein
MSFRENIEIAAGRITDFLKDKEQATSWELKTALHLSSSVMFMALGLLIAAGKAEAEPDGLNYKITKK